MVRNPVTGEIGLTPRAKRVIELAIDEARHLGHNYIGTEHLLLGLLHEGERGSRRVYWIALASPWSKRVLKQLVSSVRVYPEPRPARTTSRTPALDQLGIDLTAAARAGKLDPVIGRA